MAMKPIVLTDEGLKKLEEELDFLKTTQRREIAEKIKIAMSFGDLTENSEYDEAKNEQAIVETRIMELEDMLKRATVVDPDDISTDVVRIGNHVTVFDVEEKEEVEFYIVGSTEADPAESKISDESPIGKALMGRKVGETVTAHAPECDLLFEIRRIDKK